MPLSRRTTARSSAAAKRMRLSFASDHEQPVTVLARE
jgi:hypothetical protein